ncbi:MAG: hypothetical protein KDA83_08015 [Planctomycetales bacterium]|nr:hypothetical protein [Planctomycetales bacterium]
MRFAFTALLMVGAIGITLLDMRELFVSWYSGAEGKVTAVQYVFLLIEVSLCAVTSVIVGRGLVG